MTANPAAMPMAKVRTVPPHTPQLSPARKETMARMVPILQTSSTGYRPVANSLRLSKTGLQSATVKTQVRIPLTTK